MDSGHVRNQPDADSATARGAPNTAGAVVVYASGMGCDPAGHECMTHSALARKLARIRGFSFAGEFDASCRYACPLYFVPSATLVTLDLAHRLGIWGENDLFGGVVPFPFVATKTITHPLPAADSPAPPGWSASFARRVQHAVLPGFTAFSTRDARDAGLRLLQRGKVRLKEATGTGGLGQTVVADADALDARLQAFDPEELSRHGLILEQNLIDVETHSVGKVRVGALMISYHGTQRLTVNNNGESVYGGSDLTVTHGDLDALLRLDFPREVRMAIAQARAYHAAALASFYGMFASRCNYDILQGVDEEGRWHSGVLEQSWRIGGASGAEVAALEAFQADPGLDVVRASTTEIYGASPPLPPDAMVYFRGVDQHVGPVTKYARLETHADA